MKHHPDRTTVPNVGEVTEEIREETIRIQKENEEIFKDINNAWEFINKNCMKVYYTKIMNCKT